jgi:hypothetical protein
MILAVIMRSADGGDGGVRPQFHPYNYRSVMSHQLTFYMIPSDTSLVEAKIRALSRSAKIF